MSQSDIKETSGIRVIAKLPHGESCKGMVEHKGRIIVATCSGVYELIGDSLALITPEAAQTPEQIPLGKAKHWGDE